MSTPPSTDSRPTQRVISVVETLARHAGSGRTLTELADEVGANKSTVLSVLRELVAAGWLTRTDSLYRLGPALIKVAAQADSLHLADSGLRQALERLFARFELPCTATTLVGDTIVVLDAVGRQRDGQPASLVAGQRFPFAPPTGALFAAWDAEVRTRWLAGTAEWPEPRRERLEKGLEAIRERGVSIERLTSAGFHLRQIVTQLGGDVMKDQIRDSVVSLLSDLGPMEYSIAEVQAAAQLPVSVMAAPVRGPGGQVPITIGLHITEEISSRRVAALAEALLDEAGRLSTD